MTALRSYRLPSDANRSKTDRVAQLLPLWQQGLGRSQSTIATVFFRTGRLGHWVDAKGWTAGAGAGLSQRQWDSVNQQALGAFRSWLGNCERVFAGCVARSTLPEQTKLDLFYLNKANAWYLPSVDADGRVLDQVALSATKSVSTATLALARQIMRHVRSRVGQPDLRATRTMVMDGKVANVAASKVSSADYWVRVSTAVAGKPVNIPLRSHAAFSARLAMPGAVVANHCQVIVASPDEHGNITVDYRLVVKTPKAKKRTQGRSVGLDWGMSTLFATSDGRLLGQDFCDRLRAYDTRLQPLVKALARNGIKLRNSRRYRALVQDIRGYVSNEIGRVLNHVADDDTLRELVVEKLDLRGTGLSRQMRRLVALAGRATVASKLTSITEDHGITVTQINPAHTSRECFGCGYVHKTNRRTQSGFRCRFCGRTAHADINGARTTLGRSQQGQHWTNIGRRSVLLRLDERFQSRWGLSFAEAEQRHTNKPTPRVVLASATTATQGNESPLAT